MNNKQYKQNTPHIMTWQVAYAARELRHNKTVTLSCLKSETGNLLEQLSLFSNSNPRSLKSVQKPNSREVLLEIIESV